MLWASATGHRLIMSLPNFGYLHHRIRHGAGPSRTSIPCGTSLPFDLRRPNERCDDPQQVPLQGRPLPWMFVARRLASLIDLSTRVICCPPRFACCPRGHPAPHESGANGFGCGGWDCRSAANQLSREYCTDRAVAMLSHPVYGSRTTPAHGIDRATSTTSTQVSIAAAARQSVAADNRCGT